MAYRTESPDLHPGLFFTPDFWDHHVKPGLHQYWGYHRESRDAVRMGNLALNYRFQGRKPPQAGKAAGGRLDRNSVILEFGNQKEGQIRRLMAEVDRRNLDKTYENAMRSPDGLLTDDAYSILTTTAKGKNRFTCSRFVYGVQKAGDRYLINHFAGFDEGD